MTFSVTYYLELCSAMSIYCVSHILPTIVKYGCLDSIEHQQLYLVDVYPWAII